MIIRQPRLYYDGPQMEPYPNMLSSKIQDATNNYFKTSQLPVDSTKLVESRKFWKENIRKRTLMAEGI